MSLVNLIYYIGVSQLYCPLVFCPLCCVVVLLWFSAFCLFCFSVFYDAWCLLAIHHWRQGKLPEPVMQITFFLLVIFFFEPAVASGPNQSVFHCSLSVSQLRAVRVVIKSKWQREWNLKCMGMYSGCEWEAAICIIKPGAIRRTMEKCFRVGGVAEITGDSQIHYLAVIFTPGVYLKCNIQQWQEEKRGRLQSLLVKNLSLDVEIPSDVEWSCSLSVIVWLIWGCCSFIYTTCRHIL